MTCEDGGPGPLVSVCTEDPASQGQEELGRAGPAAKDKARTGNYGAGKQRGKNRDQGRQMSRCLCAGGQRGWPPQSVALERKDLCVQLSALVFVFGQVTQQLEPICVS